MSIVVEHEKRKEEILGKAMDVFVEEGYDEVTFQKIADRCGITRTTLYVYFKSKREIFIGSIRQLTSGVEAQITGFIHDQALSCEEKLRRTVRVIFEACVAHRKLFQVTIVYLLRLRQAGKSPAERVRRRTIRLRHILSDIIIEGIHAGEFKKVSIKTTNEILAALIESAVFRLALYGDEREDDILPAMNFVISGLLA